MSINPANAWLLLTARSPGLGFTPGGWGSVKPHDVAFALQGLERPQFLLGMAAIAGDIHVHQELVSLVKVRLILPAAEFGEWKVKRESQALWRLAALGVFEAVNRDPLGLGVRCFVCNGKGQYTPQPTEIGGKGVRQRQALRQALRRLRRLEWQATVMVGELKDAAKVGQKADPRKIKRIKRIVRWTNQLAQLTDAHPEPTPCLTCNANGVLRLTALHRAWLTGFSHDHWLRKWQSRYEPIGYQLDGWLSDCLTHVGEKFGRQA